MHLGLAGRSRNECDRLGLDEGRSRERSQSIQSEAEGWHHAGLARQVVQSLESPQAAVPPSPESKLSWI